MASGSLVLRGAAVGRARRPARVPVSPGSSPSRRSRPTIDYESGRDEVEGRPRRRGRAGGRASHRAGAVQPGRPGQHRPRRRGDRFRRSRSGCSFAVAFCMAVRPARATCGRPGSCRCIGRARGRSSPSSLGAVPQVPDANPPSIGNPDTIRDRGALWLLMVVASVSLRDRRRDAGSEGAFRPASARWNATLLACAAFVVVMGAIIGCCSRHWVKALGQRRGRPRSLLTHETPQPLRDAAGAIVYPGFDADLLYRFRLYSVAQAQCHSVDGHRRLAFAPLAERVFTGPRRDASQQEVATSAVCPSPPCRGCQRRDRAASPARTVVRARGRGFSHTLDIDPPVPPQALTRVRNDPRLPRCCGENTPRQSSSTPWSASGAAARRDGSAIGYPRSQSCRNVRMTRRDSRAILDADGGGYRRWMRNGVRRAGGPGPPRDPRRARRAGRVQRRRAFRRRPARRPHGRVQPPADPAHGGPDRRAPHRPVPLLLRRRHRARPGRHPLPAGALPELARRRQGRRREAAGATEKDRQPPDARAM